jgi:hypothetical protein
MQKMLKVTKTSKTEIKIEEHGEFVFVPFIKGVN